MISRDYVIGSAVDECIKELYSFAQPHVEWEEFKKECKEYSKKHREWEKNIHPEWKDKSMIECIGPKPFEFYFLPREVMKDICDSYVQAYRLDQQQELLDTIETLKNYCKEPIVDKWIEGKNGDPGHRGYEHPDNLEKQLTDLIPDSGFDKSAIAESVQNKFFEFLDMAGNFYSWNRDLNSFDMSVYLGPSPNSNKEAVIKNWKEYRNQDIEIDEEQIKKEYYGDDELD